MEKVVANKIHELKFTEDEIGMLIYRGLHGMSNHESDFVWRSKQHSTAGMKYCKKLAKTIFNNERAEL